jgi:hypothetical protein
MAQRPKSCTYSHQNHTVIFAAHKRTNAWHEIALDPFVYHALTEYAATIWGPGAQPAPERMRAQAHIKPGWIEPA